MPFLAPSTDAHRSKVQLSAAYACYLGGIALSVTYWPLYFEQSGLSGAQIGMIFSVATALSIVMQPVVSAWSDAMGRPVRMLRAAFLWSMAVPSALLVARGFWGFALTWWITGLMSIAIVPLLDASIVRTVGALRFGEVRLWGSVGYGLAVLLYGALMRHQSPFVTGYGAVLVWMLLLGLGALVIWSLPSPSRAGEMGGGTGPKTPRSRGAVTADAPQIETPAAQRSQDASNDGTNTRAWMRGPLLILFLINALHWWGITSFNIYIGLHVQSQGMDTGVTGMTAAAAIVGEVLAFAVARKILPANAAHRWLPVVFLTGAARWWITAFAPTPSLLIAVQLIHFLGFGVWVAALIHMIGRFVRDDQRTAAQGYMGGLTYGVGGMLGNLVSGLMFDIGGGRLVFMVAAGADILACILLLLTWRRWRLPSIEDPDRTMRRKCRERESNPQGASLREILSLLRLPVSPSRRVMGLIDERSE